jgi:hypothetical protein
MGVVSAGSDLAYLALFDSIMDEKMFSSSFEGLAEFFTDPDPPFQDVTSIKDSEFYSDPNERLPPPPVIGPPALLDVADEIGKHWLATTEKTQKLRDRLMQERAKIDTLTKQFQAGKSSDKALHDRIATGEAWLKSILDNFNRAIQDHKMAQGSHDNKILHALVSRIEQRQRAVEVALQQGPSQYVDDKGQNVIPEVTEKDKEEEVTGLLPEYTLFRMEDANLELLELDLPFYTLRESVDARQNAPPIGMFPVPKPTKRQK